MFSWLLYCGVCVGLDNVHNGLILACMGFWLRVWWVYVLVFVVGLLFGVVMRWGVWGDWGLKWILKGV